MREFFERIVQALVDNPGMVEVRQLQAGNIHILEITVDDDDVGQVIGRQGRTAAALRTLLQAMAGRDRSGLWQLEIVGERPTKIHDSDASTIPGARP